MRITCDNPHHDAGEGVCVFCVNDRVRKAVEEERQRCIDAVLSVWSAVPEDHGPWKRCQNAIHRKIRGT